jgi:hypothetical protein
VEPVCEQLHKWRKSGIVEFHLCEKYIFERAETFAHLNMIFKEIVRVQESNVKLDLCCITLSLKIIQKILQRSASM